jgi:hypothetical protein
LECNSFLKTKLVAIWIFYVQNVTGWDGSVWTFSNTVGRTLTAGNIQWVSVMRNFKEQWQALKQKKAAPEPEVPKVTKALPIIKWTEAMMDYLHRVIGVRNIPLAYAARIDVIPVGALPALATDQPYSAEHGSIEAELIARASHDHALYRDDNELFYFKLEEAVRTTAYADSIKPFQRRKDGRGAWFALLTQYAGADKWEAEIKRMDLLLHTRKWKGQSNYLLERHTQQHRNAYVSMTACAQHVDYQLPNELTRVGYLLDSIENNDAGLQAAMGAIRNDKQAGGMRSDFEAAVAHLLPMDPVSKRRTAGTKRGPAEISDATGAEVGAFGTKPGIGKSGVHLRYHTDAEYQKLPTEQQDDLRDWRKSPHFTGKKRRTGNARDKDTGGKNKRKQRHDATLAAAVAKAVANEQDTTAKPAAPPSDEAARAFIMSLMQASTSKKAAIASVVQFDEATESSIQRIPSVTPKASAKAEAKVTLKTILRKIKNNEV